MSDREIIEDIIAKRLFGPDAFSSGTCGTPNAPGIAQVKLNGQAIGTGRTLSEAIHTAVKNNQNGTPRHNASRSA